MSQEGDNCPEDKPFASKSKCISCPEDKPLYDLSEEECVPGFPEATDVSKHESNLMMDSNATNSTEEDWDAYVEENKDKVLCPDETPFWNQSECIQCPAYFNVLTYECDECPEGTTLNTDTHLCDSAEPLEPSLIDLFNAIF